MRLEFFCWAKYFLRLQSLFIYILFRVTKVFDQCPWEFSSDVKITLPSRDFFVFAERRCWWKIRKTRIFNTMPIVSSRPIVSHTLTRIFKERKCVCDLSSRYFCSAKVHIADHKLKYSNINFLKLSFSLPLRVFLDNCYRTGVDCKYSPFLFERYLSRSTTISRLARLFGVVLQSFRSSWLIQESGEQLDLFLLLLQQEISNLRRRGIKRNYWI